MIQLRQKEFRDFVTAHADRIYNHAFRMLGNREEAEEAVQDIFLKVYKGIAGFRGESSVKTWLYRITSNTCLTRLRGRKAVHPHSMQEHVPAGDRWETAMAGDGTPEDRLIAKDLNGFVLRALELIPPQEKEIMLLYHVEELNYGEISAILDVPIGTVCARLYRARNSVRAALRTIRNELQR